MTEADADDLIETALTARHRELGAKLVDFAGWRMPLEFEGTLAEHQRVRERVGVFDVSHLGTLWLTGADATATVAASFTNDATVLADGASQYTLCCDDDGGIVDDLIVYRLAADRWMVVPNAANTAAVLRALRATAQGRDVAVEDGSRDHAILAVQGPDAHAAVERALGHRPQDLEHLGLAEVDVPGGTGVLCRTGYTGEPGSELIVPNGHAVAVFDALLDGGAAPVGLGARDTLRLEMGYPLHGNDIDRSTDPFEARLGWAVKLDRGPFRGADALARRKAGGGPRRRLFGLLGTSRRPPRAGMTVHRGVEPVGTVTSGSYSPVLGVGIGLAYVADPLGPGDEVSVDVRGTDVGFEVVRPPFVDRDPKG
ncbi:MAG: glycine cleavage system aminomethyltransferase GcvT [Actinobacteria bacterium]|nr:glycine cleavage system aminomethyltransferase GcvT [Actinomycetota bacterium]